MLVFLILRFLTKRRILIPTFLLFSPIMFFLFNVNIFESNNSTKYYIFAPFVVMNSVFQIVLNQKPPFFTTKMAKNPPSFFSSQKMTPDAIFISFLCDNFSHIISKLQKKINSNTFPRFFFQIA